MIKFFKRIRYNLMSSNASKSKTSVASRYIRYAFGEIVLVVLGILIALSINDWNETQKNTNIEHNYLVAMLEDYEDNLIRSNEVISQIESTLPVLIDLLEESALAETTWPIDSLNTAFSLIGSMPFYSSIDRVYDNLTGSGDLKLITDEKLKTLLSGYYQKLEVLYIVQGTHEMELVQTYEPYIIKHLDYQAVVLDRVEDFPLPEAVDKNRILSIMHSSEFRNIITLKWTILTDLLSQNRRIKSQSQEIVNQIKNIIKNFA